MAESDDKRGDFKKAVKEAFTEWLDENKDSARTDTGKEKAKEDKKSSIFDIFG